MTKKIKISFVGTLLAATMFTACSSSDDTTIVVEPIDYSSTAITSFSLRKNSDILNNLDSVFFSIDLNSATIFNADSLPYGTKVDALGVNLTCSSSKSIRIYEPKTDTEEEKMIDYDQDETAKINFAKGPVRVHVVSYNGKDERDYYIKVNVHNQVPDSLYWSEMARTDLPTALTGVTAQKTVMLGKQVVCLTTDGAAYNLATTEDPYANAWDNKSVTFPSAVDVNTLTATDNALFILAADGSLLTSTDGTAWTSTGETWKAITAPYGTKLLGLKANGATCQFVSYPAGFSGAAPDSFPVEGSSQAVELATKWSSSNQVLIYGGRTADGSLTGAAWSFDGNQWAKISESLPKAEGYAIAETLISETDTVSWRVKTSKVLLAFGGRLADGTTNEIVYLSRDMGITWKKGDDLLQLPKYMPDTYNASTVVISRTMSAPEPDYSRAWQQLKVRELPSVYVRRSASRKARQNQTWECPYIYMFGGIKADGTLQNAIWRGVVNHFTYQPII